jgi:hypothetical protein
VINKYGAVDGMKIVRGTKILEENLHQSHSFHLQSLMA